MFQEMPVCIIYRVIGNALGANGPIKLYEIIRLFWTIRG
jgi:hypothetical protein